MSKRSKTARMENGGRKAQRRAAQLDRTSEKYISWLIRMGLLTKGIR